MITVDENKLSNIVKEEVENAIDNVLLRIRMELLPTVPKQEQDELEKIFGKYPPSRDHTQFTSEEDL